eukprot:m.89355 g.89355  ORF g.89355 m.89355 type:complete len:785 (-) comp9801_c0_seq1:94-2448(-)
MERTTMSQHRLCLAALTHVLAVVSMAPEAMARQPPSAMYACTTEASKKLPFCNADLSMDARVDDLVGRLTMDEKVSLLGAHGKDMCSFLDGGVPRLDIPSYTWCTETNTGVSTVCIAPDKCATTFPSPAALAASFNKTLWRSKATVQSTEQRAYFNLGGRRRSEGNLIGLNGWGPNINVVRDPRYGRNSELPSEDPYLNGKYAVDVVKGFQESHDPKWPLKIHATLKHYTAYSVETNRFGITLNTTLHDLFESFLPQYRAGFVEGKAGGAMCSYASLAVGANKSTPSCANEFILNHMVRDVWGATDALIVSDCGAVSSEYTANHYVPTCDDAAAASINAGCDLNTGRPYFMDGCLNHSLAAGTVSHATLDTALKRSLIWKFRLGLFDDTKDQPLASLGEESINTTSAQRLVVEAAAQGLVLLRNDDATLPLKSGIKVAVVGSHANATRSLLSDYYGDEVCFGPPSGDPATADGCIVTIGHSVSKAAQRHGGSARIEPGVAVDAPLDPAATAAALDAVAWADVVVLTAGINHAIEHEGIDRNTTELPSAQVSFANQVLATGKPTVLVLVNGGALGIDVLLTGTLASQGHAPAAVVEAFYPNQAGAAAIGPALFGEPGFNRWGRLPITMYPAEYNKQLTIEQAAMRSDASTGYPGRTYKYYVGKPLFEFGAGLSLTTFTTECTDTRNSTSLVLECTVHNTGEREGDQVLLVFHKPPKADASAPPNPIRRLINFDRVSVPSGGSAKATMAISLPDDLLLTGEDGEPRRVSGVHTVSVQGGPSFTVQM